MLENGLDGGRGHVMPGNLFVFLDFVAHCYEKQHQDRTFDRTYIADRIAKAKQTKRDTIAVKEQLADNQQKLLQRNWI